MLIIASLLRFYFLEKLYAHGRCPVNVHTTKHFIFGTLYIRGRCPFQVYITKGFIFEKLHIHMAGCDPSMHIYRFGKIAGLCHKSGITNTKKKFRDRAISKVWFFKYFPYGTPGYDKNRTSWDTFLRRSGRSVPVEAQLASSISELNLSVHTPGLAARYNGRDIIFLFFFYLCKTSFYKIFLHFMAQDKTIAAVRHNHFNHTV